MFMNGSKAEGIVVQELRYLKRDHSEQRNGNHEHSKTQMDNTDATTVRVLVICSRDCPNGDAQVIHVDAVAIDLVAVAVAATVEADMVGVRANPKPVP